MKRLTIIMILICFLTTFSFYSVEQNKLEPLLKWKIAYWSSYGVTGTFAFFSGIGQTIQASQISDRLRKIAADVKSDTGYEMKDLRQYAEMYPLFVFGVNSLIGGTSFIPVAGGIVSGSLNYMFGIALTIMSSTNPLNYFYFSDLPNQKNSKYYSEMQDIHHDMLLPTSYYVVGTFSILFGVADIILYCYYRKELLKTKYPHFQKVISFIPGGISIGLDI